MPMSEVYRISVQIQAPKGNFPGQITCGYYTVKDGLLTMTTEAGKPMLRESGLPYEHKLVDGDNPVAIAQQMTREIRLMLRGETATQAKFGKPLSYPKTGWM